MTNLLKALSGRRFKLLAVVLIAALVAPPPAPAQLFIDLAAIVGAINAIGSAISDVIAPALKAINSALGTLWMAGEPPAMPGATTTFWSRVIPAASENSRSTAGQTSHDKMEHRS